MVRSFSPSFPAFAVYFSLQDSSSPLKTTYFLSSLQRTKLTQEKIQVQPLRRPHPPPLRSATPYELALTPRHCFRSHFRNLLPLRAEIPSCTSNGDYSGRVLVFSYGVWNEYFGVG